MNLCETVSILSKVRGAVPVPDAAEIIERSPGLYSIFIDDAARLPEPFGTRLIGRHTRLIYVGMASASLYQRLIEEELRHKRSATFFRTIGAVLGYRPARGSLRQRRNKRNYKFAPTNTRAIIEWIEKHLMVRWLPLDSADIRTLEADLISELCPIFNIRHNPRPCAEVIKRRETCCRTACS